jgi:hypothetical protein
MAQKREENIGQMARIPREFLSGTLSGILGGNLCVKSTFLCCN